MTPVSYQLRLNQSEDWQMDRPHFHDAYELLLPLSDAGNLFLEDKVYPLHRGALFLISEGALHRTVTSGKYERYVMHINTKTLAELSTPQTDFLALIQDANRCILLDEEGTLELAGMLHGLHRPKSEAFGEDLRRAIDLMRLLLKVSTLLEVQAPKESVSGKDFQRIAPVLEYIRGNLAQPLSLDILSEKFFINKHHLCHIFKAATGFSVIEYVIYCRVLKARELLREGVSVQSAGEQAGFSSNSHFIRTFGELTGTSPGRYAREHLMGEKILTH